MEKYNYLQNLLRGYFYQTVFQDFETIREIILDYKKESSLQRFEGLKQDIASFRNENEAFAIQFFDRYCDGIGLDSHEEIIEVLDEINAALD